MSRTYRTNIGEGELPVEIGFDYSAGVPAKIYGPPEDCYPAEDEEIGIFSVMAMPSIKGGFEIVDILSDKVIADLSDQCVEFVRYYELNCLDDRADYDRDTMLDKQQLRKSASIEGKPPGVNY